MASRISGDPAARGRTLNNQTATTEMFAAIVVLALIGIGLFALIGLLQRLTLPWYHEARRDGAEGGKA